MKLPLRRNVLILMTLGYFTVLAVFGIMVFGAGKEVVATYDVLEAPLMALIGGTLAISKDLVDGGVTDAEPDAPPDAGE